MTQQTGRAAPASVRTILEQVRTRARDADVFGEIRLDAGRLACAARDVDPPAEYRVEWDDGRLWASLVTEDRWLSQSIEADLVHTGDKLEDLIDEELVEQGCDEGPLPFEHFRSEDMLYTFRSPLPIDAEGGDADRAVHIAACALLAYEATFRELGDMAEGDDDD